MGGVGRSRKIECFAKSLESHREREAVQLCSLTPEGQVNISAGKKHKKQKHKKSWIGVLKEEVTPWNFNYGTQLRERQHLSEFK